ncbi:MAG: RecX family transcriptional regulator [Paludibacteraceae bacterium]|nr:RecX family transcriptional regulator [Paludibacteraceae bacterium]
MSNSTNITKEQLWQKATAYCAKSEHCCAEVREKLWQWGCRDDIWRGDILRQLCLTGYIDEQRYCRAYVHDKVAFQGWGRQKIRMMLLSKGMDEALAEEALSQIDEEEYSRALKKALEKYKGDRERQIRLALQRGFDYGEILNSLRES